MSNTVSKEENEARLVKRIHALKKVLDLSDEEYKLTLFHNFRVDSSKLLSNAQKIELIEYFEEEAVKLGRWEKYEGKNRHEVLAGRPGMATPAQLRLIEALWKDTSSLKDNKQRMKGLRSFLYGHFKVSDLRFLDAVKVKKVIGALNAMLARKNSIPENKGEKS